MKPSDRDLEGIVEQLLKERFPGAEVDRVAVDPDTDADGDPVLRITVVLSTAPAILQKERLVSFTRHLKSRLHEVEVGEFPILSFVSRTEANKLKLATG
ncbi:MAG TPA: hypothetical protein VIZ17_02395 [Acetobacteraceae bacterium]